MGSDRTTSLETRTGTVRRTADGEKAHCKAIIGNWRAGSREGIPFCKMYPKPNGFCETHQFLFKTETRGAKAAVAKYKNVGNARKVAPVRALKELIDESAGNVDYLRDEVNKLEKLWIRGVKTREEVATTVLLYNEERDRLERFTTDAIRIRLEERQQEISSAQAKVLATVAIAIIDGLGLKGEARELARVKAAGILSISGAPAEDEEWKGPFRDAAEGRESHSILMSTHDVPQAARQVSEAEEAVA